MDYKEITKEMSEKLERKERGEAEERAVKEGGASPLEAALARIHELELGTQTYSYHPSCCRLAVPVLWIRRQQFVYPEPEFLILFLFEFLQLHK